MSIIKDHAWRSGNPEARAIADDISAVEQARELLARARATFEQAESQILGRDPDGADPDRPAPGEGLPDLPGLGLAVKDLMVRWDRLAGERIDEMSASIAAILADLDD